MEKKLDLKGTLVVSSIWNLITGFLAAFLILPTGWTIPQENIIPYLGLIALFISLSIYFVLHLYSTLGKIKR